MLEFERGRIGGFATEELGGQVRARREELGLSLRQAGDPATLSAGQLSRIERNQHRPSTLTLLYLGNVLDCAFYLDRGRINLIPHRESNPSQKEVAT